MSDIAPSLATPRWRPRPASVADVAPGLVAAVALAIVARLVGDRFPTVGAPVAAIVGGVLIATMRPPRPVLRPGLALASRPVLQVSVVLLGLNLSFRQVFTVGGDSLPVMVGTFAAAGAAAWLASKRLRLAGDLPLLIGVGTAVCGASAIAATSTTIAARSADVAYALTTVFVFNVAAVLTFPAFGHLFGMSQESFGVWAGTAINDTSSVVAASTAYGDQAASTAVVVKLTRTLAIVPICIVLAALRRRATATPANRLRVRTIFPMFIGAFVAAVVANTIGAVPDRAHDSVALVSSWMITLAAAAIGLSTRLADARSTGLRPLVLGATVWIAVTAASLGVQALTGSLR
jgi:uncharacterized integral membrane protein (TIGR00698 family)